MNRSILNLVRTSTKNILLTSYFCQKLVIFLLRLDKAIFYTVTTSIEQCVGDQWNEAINRCKTNRQYGMYLENYKE